MKIAIASDHGGLEMKNELIKHFTSKGFSLTDLGTNSADSVDYPDFADKMAKHILAKESDFGILICGTGIGMSLAANKIKGIRATAYSETFSAKFTRLHNDSNILCLGGRVIGPAVACEMVDLFINTDFEGGRHQRRVDMIKGLEE